MPKIEIPESEIVQAVGQLSPEGRQAALQRLLPTSAYLERAIASNRPTMEALASARGLDWNALDEAEREQLIDDVLHE